MSKPLTLEQLKALSSEEWVWIKLSGGGCFYAQKSNSSDSKYNFVALHHGVASFFKYEYYGKCSAFGWTAWKNKEQAESVEDAEVYKKALVLAVCKFHDACDIIDDCKGTEIAIEWNLYMQDDEGNYTFPLDVSYFIECAKKALEETDNES